MKKSLFFISFFIYFFFFLSENFILSTASTSPDETQISNLTSWLKKAQSNIVKKILPNGLTVLCYSLPNTFKVRIGVTYNVGSKDEQAGEYGLAHMVEHMIFKGTEKMSESDLKAISEKFCIGSFGQGYNAHTTYDQTAYFFNTDKLNWPVFLNILADCMFNARFDENHFASEVKAVINEINIRTAKPEICIFDMLGQQLLPAYHPYAHSIGGHKPDLLTAKSDHLKAFYKRHYHPSQATLIVVGDIDTEKTLKTIEETFALYQSNQEFTKTECKTSLWASHESMQKKITFYKPIPRPYYSYVWILPEENGISEGAAAAQYALYYRLSKILKDERDLVYSLHIGNFSFFLQGFFYCFFEPKDNGDTSIIKTIKKIITHEINNIAQHGTTEEELHSFKKMYESDFLQSFEKAESIWSELENNYFPHCNELELFNKLERAKNISHDDIKNFCSIHLRSRALSEFRCLPIPEKDLPAWLNKQEALDAHEQKILAQKIRDSSIEAAELVHTLPEPQLIEFSTQKPDQIITLSNGLNVYLKFRDTTPFIYTSLHFKNPELFDIYHGLKKQENRASYAMTQLHQASVGYSKEETRDFFHKHGASFDFNKHGGSFTCLRDAYALIGTRFIHILSAPEYPEKMINQALQNALVSIKHAQEEPGPIAVKKLLSHLFKDYPWSIDDAEKIQQLTAITQTDLFSFNKQFVHPGNMFAVIVGNYDSSSITHQLEQIFGNWKAGADAITPDYSTITIPELNDTQICNEEIFLPKEQVVIAAGRITPEFETDDRMALKLIEQYLKKKLYEIREQTGLFYSLGCILAGHSFYKKEMGFIQLQVSVDKVVQAEIAIKQVLADVAHHGIPHDQLIITKQTYQMTLAKGCATNHNLLSHYTYLIESEKDWNFLDTCIQKIHAISNDDVNAVAQKYLDPDTWSFVKVGRIGL